MTAYIDLNIFDQLEKPDKWKDDVKAHYQLLDNLLKADKLTTSYSNAHLNDLFRGFQKDSQYIDGHLKNIQSFTKNLCICQYWGENSTRVHYRDIFEFFEAKKNEWKFESASYSDLFSDEPMMRQAMELYKLVPLPNSFKKGYQEPMFGIMFPQAKVHNTYYSLHEDIFNFQMRLKSDYGFYKSFRNYLLTSLHKLKNNKDFIKTVKLNPTELPKHLELHEVFNAFTPNDKTSDNTMYSKIIDTFFKYDLSGYKGDGHFNNMFDDALHTFYAAYFDVFITNDDRCHYKAQKTYERLKINTKVIKVNEIHTLQLV